MILRGNRVTWIYRRIPDLSFPLVEFPSAGR